MAETEAHAAVVETVGKGPEGGGSGKRWLVLVLAFYLALHLAYAFVSTPLDGPDEPQHVQYVRSLALYHQLPLFEHMRNDFEARPMVLHTALHGPVYYALLAPFYRMLRLAGEDVALQGMRHLTGLLGIPLILLTYAALARVFGPASPVCRWGTTATALHPLTLYLGSVVSNEMLAAVWVALAFFYLARILTSEAGARPWLGVGVALALGLLTKYTSIVIVPAALLVMAWRWRRQTPRPGVAALAQCLVALLLPTVILGAPWFARSLAQHGELFALQYDQPRFPGGVMQALVLPEASFPAVAMVLLETLRTYVGPLWLFREWPSLFVSLTPLWALLFLWPVLGWARGRWAKAVAAPAERALYLAAGLALAANIAGVLNTCLFKQWLMWIFAGRFLLVSLPGAMLLCVAGASGWARAASPRRHLPAAAFCLALAVQNAWLIPAVWRFYHR